MQRLAAAALLLSSFVVLAGPPPLKTAASAVERARSTVERASGACRRGTSEDLAELSMQLNAREMMTDERVRELRSTLLEVSTVASRRACPPSVMTDLTVALESLEEARREAWERRDRRRDERREEGSNFATVKPLRVTTDSVWNGRPAVRVMVPELRLDRMAGRTFYFGVRYRSFEGDWSEWTTTQVWSVPNDAFVWKEAFNHFIPHSALAEDDFTDGRFVVHVGVFDVQSQQELASRDAVFQVRVAPLPPPAPSPSVVLPPVGVARDCGTGQDIGCLMQRDGRWPMDGASFNGFVASLKANGNEVLRSSMCESVLKNNFITASQLGVLMDLFNNELFRLSLTKLAAQRVVNPQHALVLATKFRNSMFAADFTKVMSSQPAGAEPQPPQPNRPQFLEPPRYARMPQQPPAVVRDCGTGTNDVGCSMQRNGGYAMDALTFQGYLASMRANGNELVRADVCETMLRANQLTADQLKVVLGLFNNELTRLDVAKKAAPRVVNPQHAIGLAAMFNNTFSARDYTEIMAAQQ